MKNSGKCLKIRNILPPCPPARWLFITGMMLILSGCRNPLPRPTQADLASNDSQTKIRAIHYLTQQNQQSSIPALVELLEDEDKAVRFYAINALTRLTGQTYGYDYKAPPKQRAQAVQLWRDHIDQQLPQQQQQEQKDKAPANPQ